IDGKKGNDTICGRDSKDELKGGGGDDTIFGEGGNDNIKGDKGNDTIHGGDGDDVTLDGGDGDDTIYGDAGNDKIKGGKGIDTIYGGDGDDNIDGGGEDDTIRGQAGADTIKGSKGDDIICGNTEGDNIHGDDGNDKIDAGPDTDTVDGGKGKDLCLNGETVSKCETLTGSIPECDESSSSNSSTSSFSSSSSTFSSSSSTPTECSPTETTLNAYWKFDEGTGTSAADSTSYNNLGTLENGAAWTSSAPSLSYDNPGALSFDGTDDYVAVPDVTGLSFSSTPFSVVAWVYPETLGIDRQVVSKGYDGTNTEWEIKTTTADGKVGFRSWNGANIGVQSLNPLVAGTWTHVAGVYDGTNWSIFLDGVLDNSVADIAPVLTTRPVYIGAVDANGTPAQFWEGMIDDVRVYGRALTCDEIADMASGMCTGESSSSSSSSSFSSDSSSSSFSSDSSSSSSSESSSGGGGIPNTGNNLNSQVPGEGAHRGADTTTIMTSLNASIALATGFSPRPSGFALAPGGFGGGPITFSSTDLPPPGYGGGPVELTPEQKTIICKAQNVLGQYIERSGALNWVASLLAQSLSLNRSLVYDSLLDQSICEGVVSPRVTMSGLPPF
ncbi:MAG: hypothetical protein PHI23_01695, partial [Candidatus Peribacteraceae bacterium]|nr:hypothetical protein [Candidatus Peribacteraceae bacterium]